MDYFSSQFFLVPPAETFYDDASISIVRKRSVGDGFHEDITVLNHTGEDLDLELRLEAAADFADLFEVKDALAKQGEHYRNVEDSRLVLGYRRGRYVRETWITATAGEAELVDDGIRFRLRIDPHGEWTTCVDSSAPYALTISAIRSSRFCLRKEQPSSRSPVRPDIRRP